MIMEEKIYKNLFFNKLSTYKNTNEIVDYLSLFKQYNKGLKYVMVLDRSIIERLYTAKSYNELDTRIKELNQLEDFYVGYSYTNKFGMKDFYKEVVSFIKAKKISTVPLHNTRYLLDEDKIVYEALKQIDGKKKEIKFDEDIVLFLSLILMMS